MAVKKKTQAISYEDFDYYFVHFRFERLWSGTIEITPSIGDRYLPSFNYHTWKKENPTQEDLNERAIEYFNDKMYDLFNGQFADKDHEHTFVAR